MDLKSLGLYVAVIALSAGLAYVVFRDTESVEESPPAIEEVDDPAWYRDASLGTRSAALKKRLALMTSRAIAPEQTGPVKDEIALLCRDEALVDVVVDAFESHPKLTPALLSAYMEIFARVKHPKFAALLDRGFQSSEFDVRMNAADAGIIQGDVRAVREMGDAMQVASGAQANRILSALITVGGGEAMMQVEGVLEREEPEFLVPAIRALGQARYAEAMPRIRTRMDHPAPSVVLAASMALAMFGQQDGYLKLKALAQSNREDQPVRAEAVQFLFTVSGAKDMDFYRELAVQDNIVGFEATLNLVKLGDEEAVAKVHRRIKDGSPIERAQCVGLLGASGRTEDVDYLAARVKDMDRGMLRAMVNSLKRGKATNATTALAALARLRRGEAGLALHAFPSFGEAGLDDLVRLLDEEEDPYRRDIILRAVASIPCQRSLEILESVPVNGDRDLWLLLRSLIRKVDLGLLKK